MSAPPFVHLHCHSHYSLLDGAGEIGALVQKAKASGMNALALTDHGNLYGALQFYRQAREAGIQRMALEGAVEVARRMGIPLVATSDAHYVNQQDAEAQDILLCVNTGKFRTDANRMRMETNEFHLRTPEEMYAAFEGTFAAHTE